MPTRLDGLFRTDPMLNTWLKMELSIIVGMVYPFTKSLMAKTFELHWILGY